MHESDITLGDEYRDHITGFQGVAVARFEFLTGCTRIRLETSDDDGERKKDTFDAPRLVEVKTGERVTSDDPGGPRAGPASKDP